MEPFTDYKIVISSRFLVIGDRISRVFDFLAATSTSAVELFDETRLGRMTENDVKL